MANEPQPCEPKFRTRVDKCSKSIEERLRSPVSAGCRAVETAKSAMRHGLIFFCALAIAAMFTPKAGGIAARFTPKAPALPSAPCGNLSGPPAQYEHVVWIWLENRSYADVIGNAGGPYFNLLAQKCGLARKFYNETHRSWRNYMVATSGAWYTDGLTRKRSLFEQVQDAGKSWKVYAQTMPSNCYLSDWYGLYERDYNAPTYYTALRDTTCPLYDLPMGTTTRGALTGDIQANTLPNYSQILPDNCSNMHHDCNGGDNTAAVADGDAFLQTWIPAIASTPDYQSGRTIIFVTFDEGRPYLNSGENCLAVLDESCHIPTLVISPYSSGQNSDHFFSHYALLNTSESLLGLPCLRLACSTDPFYGADSMRIYFGI